MSLFFFIIVEAAAASYWTGRAERVLAEPLRVNFNTCVCVRAGMHQRPLLSPLASPWKLRQHTTS